MWIKLNLRTRYSKTCIPEAQEQNDGKNVVIIFKKGIQGIVKRAVQQKDFSEEAIILAKTSAIVRRDNLTIWASVFLVTLPKAAKNILSQLV